MWPGAGASEPHVDNPVCCCLFKKTALLTYSHSHLLEYSLWSLVLQWQSWIVTKEILGITTLKIFTCGLLQEVCWPLSQSKWMCVGHSLLLCARPGHSKRNALSSPDHENTPFPEEPWLLEQHPPHFPTGNTGCVLLELWETLRPDSPYWTLGRMGSVKTYCCFFHTLSLNPCIQVHSSRESSELHSLV